jgi:hypothetical protein
VAVECLPELPLTAVGKPFKPELRARAIEALVTARIADTGETGVTLRARLTDHGLAIEVEGTDDAVRIAREALSDLAIEAEVQHVQGSTGS